MGLSCPVQYHPSAHAPSFPIFVRRGGGGSPHPPAAEVEEGGSPLPPPSHEASRGYVHRPFLSRRLMRNKNRKCNRRCWRCLLSLIILFDAIGGAKGVVVHSPPPPSPTPPSVPRAPPASASLTGKRCTTYSYGHDDFITCDWYRAANGTLLRSQSSRAKSCWCLQLDLRNINLTTLPAEVFDGLDRMDALYMARWRPFNPQVKGAFSRMSVCFKGVPGVEDASDKTNVPHPTERGVCTTVTPALRRAKR